MAWARPTVETVIVRWVGIVQRLRDTSLNKRSWRFALVLAVLLLVAVAIVHNSLAARRERQRRQAALALPITTVTALGRLEPEGEVINVAAPAGGLGSAQVRLRQVLVE